MSDATRVKQIPSAAHNVASHPRPEQERQIDDLDEYDYQLQYKCGALMKAVHHETMEIRAPPVDCSGVRVTTTGERSIGMAGGSGFRPKTNTGGGFQAVVDCRFRAGALR